MPYSRKSTEVRTDKMQNPENLLQITTPTAKGPSYQALKHAQPAHEEYVVVNWCLGNTCNYSCSYCPSGLHDGSTAWPSLQTVIGFCEKVIDHYKDKKLYFEFTGGEVTLWKDLPALADFLRSKNCRIGIISNGSRSLEFWEKFITRIDHVCLSFHPESAKADHFLKVAKLSASKVRTHVNLMMHPDFFPECLALAYKVKDLPDVSIAIQPLVKDFGEEVFPYTEAQSRVINTQNSFLAKQIKYEKKYEYYRGAMDMVGSDGKRATMSPQRFISSGQNSWKNWNCYAGLEQIVVNMQGKIYRGWCCVGGSLGRITDEKLKLPTRPVWCNKDFCHCNLDIMTTKVKPPVLQRFSARMGQRIQELIR